ncbi:hypothetical protein ACFL1Y_02005 [Patescibacteria group bacterium]
MNKNKSQDNTKKQSNIIWWILGIVGLLIISTILSNTNNKTNTSNINKAPLPCTNFKYSDWSSCSIDGTQNRTITEAFPNSCSGGNPITFQECEYKPIDVGTGPEMLDRMISQIRAAKNQTIESSYISGEKGELLQKLSYKILDDFLVIRSTLVHRYTNTSEPTVDFIDSDLDGFVDYYAKEDQIVYPFSDQERPLAQVTFAVYLANFANHHLKK